VTARRVALTIYESVALLQKFPHRGRPGRETSTRELVIPNLPYVVIYRIREQIIEITRILHGAQSWPGARTEVRASTLKACATSAQQRSPEWGRHDAAR
jgi:plasmid stabilization system protein ParE